MSSKCTVLSRRTQRAWQRKFSSQYSSSKVSQRFLQTQVSLSLKARREAEAPAMRMSISASPSTASTLVRYAKTSLCMSSLWPCPLSTKNLSLVHCSTRWDSATSALFLTIRWVRNPPLKLPPTLKLRRPLLTRNKRKSRQTARTIHTSSIISPWHPPQSAQLSSRALQSRKTSGLNATSSQFLLRSR